LNDSARLALDDAARIVELLGSVAPELSALTFDRDLRVVACAGTGFARHGLGSAERLAGRRIDEILPAESWALVADEYRSVLSGVARTIRFPTPDGGVYTVRFVPLLDEASAVVGGLFLAQDVTVRPPEDIELESAQRRHQALVDVAVAALALTGREQQAQRATEVVAEALDAELVAVFECEPDGPAARLVSGIGWRPELAEAGMDLGDVWHVEHTLSAGTPTLVPDLTAETRFDDRLLAANGAVSGMAATIAGKPAQVLSVFRRRLAPLDGEEVSFVGWVTRLLGLSAQRRALEEAALHAALHDPLTGLPNRNLLLDRLDSALRHAGRYGGRVAVLFVDIDGFKTVNDHHGHHAGDEVLCAVADRLTGCVRDADSVARYGGDEFVILAEHVADGQAAQLERRIGAAFRWPFVAGGHEHRLGASVGCAESDGGDAEPDALLRRADEAMYQAKAARRAPGG
jgi:diguanylate cyclase (GGDEF)-like protein